MAMFKEVAYTAYPPTQFGRRITDRMNTILAMRNKPVNVWDGLIDTITYPLSSDQYANWLYDVHVTPTTKTALNWSTGQFRMLQNGSGDAYINYGYLMIGLMIDNGITSGARYHVIKNEFETLTRTLGWWGSPFLNWEFGTGVSSLSDTASNKSFVVESGNMSDLVFESDHIRQNNDKEIELQWNNSGVSDIDTVFAGRRRNVVIDVDFLVRGQNAHNQPIELRFEKGSNQISDDNTFGYRFLQRDDTDPFLGVNIFGQRSVSYETNGQVASGKVSGFNKDQRYQLKIFYFDDEDDDVHSDTIIIKDYATTPPTVLYQSTQPVDTRLYNVATNSGYDPRLGAYLGESYGSASNVPDGLRLILKGALYVYKIGFSEYNVPPPPPPPPPPPLLIHEFDVYEDTDTSAGGAEVGASDTGITLDQALQNADDNSQIYVVVYDKDTDTYRYKINQGTSLIGQSPRYTSYVKKQITNATFSFHNADSTGYTVRLDYIEPLDATQEYEIGFRIIVYDLSGNKLADSTQRTGILFQPEIHDVPTDIRINRADHAFYTDGEQTHRFYLAFYIGNRFTYGTGGVNTPFTLPASS
jgi:hypothetical protein